MTPLRANAHRTVGQAARLGGVTVRTLHHYESIGLLTPSERSATGYRLYSAADLDRLTRILYYRELGFPLEDIATLLGEANTDTASLAQHLDRQHELLTERLARLQGMVAALDKERQALTMGTPLTPEEKLEIFGEDYDPSWEEEAEQRWGKTDAWRQSAARNKNRSKADWQRLKDEGDAFGADLLAAFTSGAAPDSEQARALAERHRGMISQHYDCSYAMHRQLADMYLADPRFTKNYEDMAPGLAQWVHDAIHANADQHPDDQGEGFH
jgi:MerR family transcriptional regulator, thiopeptide resistance regulator